MKVLTEGATHPNFSTVTREAEEGTRGPRGG